MLSQSKPGSDARFFGLDLLRVIAAWSVTISHGLLVLAGPYPWCGTAICFLDFGVPLFFALSGYLIGGLLLRLGEKLAQPTILAGFWCRRWLRTLPNYFLFLCLNVLLVTVVFDFKIPGGAPAVVQHVFFLQNFWHASTWFYPESWTLAVEEWFYLLLPLGLWLLLKLGVPFRRAFVGGITALIVFSTATRFWRAPSLGWSPDLRYTVVHHLDNIALGSLAAVLRLSFPQRWQARRGLALALGIALLGMTGFAYLRLDRGNAPATLAAVIFSAQSLGCVLLLPWATTLARPRSERAARAVTALATWSYALYLSNLPIIQLLYGSGWIDGGAPRWHFVAGVFACWTLSLVVSVGIYRGLERPIMAWRERLSWCRQAR